jgi:hypothetical protein
LEWKVKNYLAEKSLGLGWILLSSYERVPSVTIKPHKIKKDHNKFDNSKEKGFGQVHERRTSHTHTCMYTHMLLNELINELLSNF